MWSGPVWWQSCVAQLKSATKRLKVEVFALLLAMDHPDTPLLAKIIALATVSYALSPIDLIPDFIPVLGVLDDLILVPAGLWLARKLIPPHVMVECREAARDDGEEEGGAKRKKKKPRTRGALIASGLVVLFWTAVSWKLFEAMYAWWQGPTIENAAAEVAEPTGSS
jgi:uncharacterized membrane protein YkvA (DUF1232 family)